MRHILLLTTVLIFSISFGQNFRQIINKGQISKIEKWINKNENLTDSFEISSGDENIWVTPIEYAVYKEQFDIVDLIMKNKHKFKNYKSSISQTIGYLSSLGKLEYIKKFVDHGADINTPCRGCNGNYPLGISVSYSNIDIFNYLVSQGADANLSGNIHLVHHLASSDHPVLLDSILLEHPEWVNLKDNEGFIPLFYSVANGKSETYEILTNHRANSEFIDPYRRSILDWSFLSEDTSFVKKMFKIYPELEGNNLIYLATSLDNKWLFDLAIKNSTIDAWTFDKVPQIFGLLDSENNTEYFVTQLAKYGADFYFEDDESYTIFDWAKVENKALYKILNKKVKSGEIDF